MPLNPIPTVTSVSSALEANHRVCCRSMDAPCRYRHTTDATASTNDRASDPTTAMPTTSGTDPRPGIAVGFWMATPFDMVPGAIALKIVARPMAMPANNATPRHPRDGRLPSGKSNGTKIAVMHRVGMMPTLDSHATATVPGSVPA